MTVALPTATPNAEVVALFAAAQRALVDSAATSPPDRYLIEGRLTGVGMSGRFRIVREGSREREEMQLGPREQTTLRDGHRWWRVDTLGIPHELRGIGRAREVTEGWLESGEIFAHPEWATCLPRVVGHLDDECLVMPPGGEHERILLDRFEHRLVEIRYPEGDGLTRILLDDWRMVDGVAFAYHRRIIDAHGEVLDERVDRIDLQRLTADLWGQPLTTHALLLREPEHIALAQRDGHWLVPVSIGGHTYQFVLDTGSQSLVLDRRVAAEVGLFPEGSVGLRAGQWVGGAGWARIPRIEVGRAVFGDELTVVTDLGTTNDGTARIDGILGFPFVAQSDLRLDPHTASLTLAAPGTLAPLGRRLDTDLDTGVPEVTASLAMGPDGGARFVVDTGSSATVLLNRAFVAKYPQAVRLGLGRDVTLGIGGSVPAIPARVARLHIVGLPAWESLDGEVMQVDQGVFADRHQAGSLGMGLFGDAILTFSAVNHALWVCLPTSSAATPRGNTPVTCR